MQFYKACCFHRLGTPWKLPPCARVKAWSQWSFQVWRNLQCLGSARFSHVCQPSSMSVWIKAPLFAHSPITWLPLLPYAFRCHIHHIFIHILTRLRRVCVCQPAEDWLFWSPLFFVAGRVSASIPWWRSEFVGPCWTIVNAIDFDQAMWQHSCSLMQSHAARIARFVEIHKPLRCCQHYPLLSLAIPCSYPL